MKRQRKKESSKLTAAFIEEWANFKPIIDQATLDKMNATAESASVTRERRLTFWLLTQDADDVSKLSAKEPELYADMIGFVGQFRDRMKAVRNLQTRVGVLGCLQYPTGCVDIASTFASALRTIIPARHRVLKNSQSGADSTQCSAD